MRLKPLRLRVAPAICALALPFAAACGPAEPSQTPVQPAPVVASAQPVTTAEPEPAVAQPEPTATPDPTPAATTGTYPELVDSPGDARLEPGALLLKTSENMRARVALTTAVSDVDATGSLDAKMAGHTLLGRTCQSLGDVKCATAHYQTVRELWKDPDAGVKALAALGGDEKAQSARLARALQAAGEALFHAAEQKRALADKEKVPTYSGDGSRQDVVNFIRTKVTAWVKARRAALEEAEKAYAAIPQLRPVPPPRWIIASASRVGDMWAKFVAEFRAMPIPKEWNQTGPHPTIPDMTWEEIRRTFYETLDEASEPQRARAHAAFEKCHALAQTLAVTDAFSRRCDDWLSKNPKPAPKP